MDNRPGCDSAGAPRPTRRQAATSAAAVALSAVLAAVLALGLDVPWQQAAGLPLLVCGALLIAWSTHAGLCFAAFAITPFGVVQQEILGVTLNLPEVLILALAAKEGYRFLSQRERFPALVPVRSLAAFLCAAAVAVATGFVYQNGAVRVLQDCRQFTEYLALFWLVLQRVSGRDEALRIAFCYVLGATLIAIHGIVQQFVAVGMVPSQVLSDLDLYSGIRSSSFYGATTLGGLMVLAIAPAAGVLLSSKHTAARAIMGLCMLLCLTAIVFTRTRASWIGLAVALPIIAISIRPNLRLLAAAVCAAAVLGLVLGPLVIQRLSTLADPVNDRSIVARVQYYAAAARIGQAHPLLGLGWGCYYDIDSILGIERYVPLEVEPAEVEVLEEATVHSAYLQLFVKTGLLGIGAFLAVLVVWLERLWRSRHIRFRGDAEHALFVGISAGIAGYLLHCTFENFFQWPVMAQSFWLLIGLSFVLAPGADGQRPDFRVPLAFTGSVAALFLLFMYGCVRLEERHPNHGERNAALALEAGDLDRALAIAKEATEARWNEPGPYAVHARLLFMKGDTEAALAELEKSVDAAEKPRAVRARNTGAYYYFTPARLLWGDHFARQGAWDRAQQQFELARAYADLRSESYAEYHPVLYETYARRGRWDRALEFGRPDASELAAMPSADLIEIASIAEGRGDWALADDLIPVLSAGGGRAGALAPYLAGRAHLIRNDLDAAVAALREASPDFAPNAPYFLGDALEKAGITREALAAWLDTPADAFLRPLAAARAWQLAGAIGSAGLPWREPLLAEFRHFLGSMHPLPEAGRTDDPHPLAYSIPDGAAASGGPFPMFVIWGHDSAAWDNLSGLSVRGDEVFLEGTGLILQLRYVENRVDWAGVERAHPGDDGFPGWVDTARDWFDLRDTPSAPVPAEDAGDPCLRLDRLAWYYSVPARVARDRGCLLAGRVRDPDGSGRLGWQFIDERNRWQRSGHLHNAEPRVDWTPLAAYLPPDPDRDAVRVIAETTRPICDVDFDDILLLELDPPDRDESAPDSAGEASP